MLKDCLNIFKTKSGALVLVLFAIHLGIENFLTALIESELLNSNGTSQIIWLYGALSLFFGLTIPLYATAILFLSWNREKASFNQSQSQPPVLSQPIGDSVILLFKESLRVFGKSLSWGFLFILPGFVAYFLMSLTPLVVLFDKQYHRGKIDALRQSKILVMRVWMPLLFFTLIFGLLIPLSLTALDPWSSFSEHPFAATLVFALEFLTFLVFQRLIFKYWEKANEFDISKN